MLKKSVMLVAVVCALAMPSMASGASWGVVGTTHVLDSSNLSFSVPAITVGWICTASQFHVDVTSAARLTVTSATFDSCHGSGTAGGGCAATFKATLLPWTITGPSTTNIQAHGLHFDLRFDGTCQAAGLDLTVTGTATQGTWDAAAHQITFASAPGLELFSADENHPVTMSGTIRDTTQTLTLS
jgi:hypothetical protein